MPSLADIVSAIQQLDEENKQLRRQLIEVQHPSNRPKLSDSEVKRIRYMKREGAFSNVQLADMFDVNPGTISRIVRGIYHKNT